jgi:hypothetical protein
VAYVPELNLYLDGTAEYAALGELPPDDQGALAMTVDAEGKATRRKVPLSGSSAPIQEIRHEKSAIAQAEQ